MVEVVPLPERFELKVTPLDAVMVSTVNPLVTVSPPFKVTASDSTFSTKLVSTVEDKLAI